MRVHGHARRPNLHAAHAPHQAPPPTKGGETRIKQQTATFQHQQKQKYTVHSSITLWLLLLRAEQLLTSMAQLLFPVSSVAGRDTLVHSGKHCAAEGCSSFSWRHCTVPNTETEQKRLHCSKIWSRVHHDRPPRTTVDKKDQWSMRVPVLFVPRLPLAPKLVVLGFELTDQVAHPHLFSDVPLGPALERSRFIGG